MLQVKRKAEGVTACLEKKKRRKGERPRNREQKPTDMLGREGSPQKEERGIDGLKKKKELGERDCGGTKDFGGRIVVRSTGGGNMTGQDWADRPQIVTKENAPIQGRRDGS